MNSVALSISKIFKGAARTIDTFPVTIAFAFLFAFVTFIRIQVDWPQQEQYNFLFNCLHLSFAFGAVSSLMLITFVQSRFNTKSSLLFVNILGIVITAVAFLLLYFYGATTELSNIRYTSLSSLAVGRIIAAMLISMLAFIVLAEYPKVKSGFSQSLFMTHKAFFIALLYGTVILAGTSGVATAVKALLYHGMSDKVYMYLGTLAGFLAFTIFVGYFPDFRKGINDDHREEAQKQPRFIEILFGYILVPITLALTIVLLLWAGQSILKGNWPSFMMLYRIAAVYAIGGIWLHIMVTDHETGVEKFYRKIYPVAALIILAFEAWALYRQINQFGLKITEYWFIIIWITAVLSSCLLLILKENSHNKIILVTCIAALVSVSPVIGYHSLPVLAQLDRLENLLTSQGMLQSGNLVPASKLPNEKIRESITDAVSYVANSKNAKLPDWFDKNLDNSEVFKQKLGFEQTWPKPDQDYYPGDNNYLSLSLVLRPEPMDISNYQWSVTIGDNYGKQSTSTFVKGKNGEYQISWISDTASQIPLLQIKNKDKMILEQSMSDYIETITKKYPPLSGGGMKEVSIEDMSLKLETEEISVLLIFSNIDINVDVQNDSINYWLNLKNLYLHEK